MPTSTIHACERFRPAEQKQTNKQKTEDNRQAHMNKKREFINIHIPKNVWQYYFGLVPPHSGICVAPLGPPIKQHTARKSKFCGSQDMFVFLTV